MTSPLRDDAMGVDVGQDDTQCCAQALVDGIALFLDGHFDCAYLTQVIRSVSSRHGIISRTAMREGYGVARYRRRRTIAATYLSFCQETIRWTLSAGVTFRRCGGRRRRRARAAMRTSQQYGPQHYRCRQRHEYELRPPRQATVCAGAFRRRLTRRQAPENIRIISGRPLAERSRLYIRLS